MIISKRIKELRKINGLTQQQLAEKLEVTASAVGLWETEKRVPDHQTILNLSKIFNVTTDYLLTDEITNKVVFLGRNGSFESFKVNDKNKDLIKTLLQTLDNPDLD